MQRLDRLFELKTRLTFFGDVRAGSPVAEENLLICGVENRLSGDPEPACTTVLMLVGG